VAITLRSAEVIATLPAAVRLQSAEGILEVQTELMTGPQGHYGRIFDPKVRTSHTVLFVYSRRNDMAKLI